MTEEVELGTHLLSIGVDLLEKILSNLSIRDRVSIETVSKEFRTASISSWRLSENDFTTIAKEEILKKELRSAATGTRFYVIDINLFTQIWLWSIPFVVNLNFSGAKDSDAKFPVHVTNEILGQMVTARGRKASSLRKLRFGAFTFNGKGIELLRTFLDANDITHIKLMDFGDSLSGVRLRVGYNSGMIKILASIFEKCQNLKRLILEGCGLLFISPRHPILKSLPRSLQTLRLDMIDSRSLFDYEQEDISGDMWFMGCWGRPFPSLRVLSLNHSLIGPCSMAGIEDIFPNLTELDISCLATRKISALKELGLQKLYLNHTISEVYDGDRIVNDYYYSTILEELADCTISRLVSTLKVLHLNECNRLNEDGLSHIAKFSQLEELSLEGTNMATGPMVMDQIFAGCSRLKALTVRYSKEFNDHCLQSLGVSCPGISYLDVSYCLMISYMGICTLTRTLESHRNRPEGANLRVYCYNTSIEYLTDDLSELRGQWFDGEKCFGIVELITDDVVPPKRYKYAKDYLKICMKG